MTREEALFKAKDVLDEATAYEEAVCYVTGDDREWLEMAIEALEQVTSYETTIVKLTQAISEQEPILDKIRAEIDELDVLKFSSGERIYKDEVLDIIDKYKAESEEEE